MRDAISSALAEAGVVPVGKAGDLEETEQRCREMSPSVLVIEDWIQSTSVIAAAEGIRRTSPETRVVCVLLSTSSLPIQDALRSGVRAVLDEESSLEDLVAAINDVGKGEIVLSPSIAQRLAADVSDPAESAGVASLSPREREVLALIADGLSTRNVAGVLGISPRTAETHRASLMSKLGIHKVSELVRVALREGLLPP